MNVFCSGFFKLFFPPEGARSSSQCTGGLPFAAAAFLHGAGRTSGTSRLTPRKPNPSPDLVSHARSLHHYCTSRAAPGCWKALPSEQHEHPHQPWAAAAQHFLFHVHRLNFRNTKSFSGWRCNFFKNSDSVHFHLENVLLLLNIVSLGISTWHGNPIDSNMEAAKPNTNFWPILSYIITLHIGHNFLF